MNGTESIQHEPQTPPNPSTAVIRARQNQLPPHVDAILLDSGNQALDVKELGGTGRTHDWALSRKTRDTVPVPTFLAGGLHAENVAHAIRQVRPFGVDVCSGVRTQGKLDPVKLEAFFLAVRNEAGADD